MTQGEITGRLDEVVGAGQVRPEPTLDEVIVRTLAADAGSSGLRGWEVVADALRETYGPATDPVPHVLAAICQELVRLAERPVADDAGDAIRVLGAMVGGLFRHRLRTDEDATLTELNRRGLELRRAIDTAAHKHAHHARDEPASHRRP